MTVTEPFWFSGMRLIEIDYCGRPVVTGELRERGKHHQSLSSWRPRERPDPTTEQGRAGTPRLFNPGRRLLPPGAARGAASS